ncbi:hypothetical protein GB881_03930 [Georgenia subflava]|uniref:Uncharacterized protein n=1 Tax=Georgenia subflava TaxID=1622177 RepID=A0A6N7EGA1_9MICO|nr:hypothetical protein [Georgenia subflava]
MTPMTQARVLQELGCVSRPHDRCGDRRRGRWAPPCRRRPSPPPRRRPGPPRPPRHARLSRG